MLTIILRTIKFCVYHLCVVIASHISKIQVHETTRQRDQLLRRYLAAMTEIRILKSELVRVKGKHHSPPMKVRCAHTKNDCGAPDFPFRISFAQCSRNFLRRQLITVSGLTKNKLPYHSDHTLDSHPHKTRSDSFIKGRFFVR